MNCPNGKLIRPCGAILRHVAQLLPSGAEARCRTRPRASRHHRPTALRGRWVTDALRGCRDSIDICAHLNCAFSLLCMLSMIQMCGAAFRRRSVGALVPGGTAQAYPLRPKLVAPPLGNLPMDRLPTSPEPCPAVRTARVSITADTGTHEPRRCGEHVCPLFR